MEVVTPIQLMPADPGWRVVYLETPEDEAGGGIEPDPVIMWALCSVTYEARVGDPLSGTAITNRVEPMVWDRVARALVLACEATNYGGVLPPFARREERRSSVGADE